MKVSIKVANRDEAKMVLRGLADPEMFALVKIVGALLALQPRAQGRVLRWAEDKLAEEPAAAPADKPDPAQAGGNGGLPPATTGGEPRLPGVA